MILFCPHVQYHAQPSGVRACLKTAPLALSGRLSGRLASPIFLVQTAQLSNIGSRA